jgi:formylglycine-generating enzyme required for sulfatase activity/CRP-like cAMP-binding protein/chromosome segregation ATPase
MRAAKKAKIDKKVLYDLVPLNALSESRFGKMAEKILVEEVKAGKYLFRKGDRDGQSIYLLDGEISLIDGFRNVTGEIESGTDMARYPIANLQPRALSAKATRKSVVARIDSNLLDVFLACDQTQTADVVEIDGADTGDWMTRILQSEVFSKLPPAKIQSLLMKMKPFSLAAGETVIRQGDEGDYFYTIHEGRCAVTRRETPDGEDFLLAELEEGDSFGEDALVSNTTRNATVTMLTDGTLMRLAKQDFVELLKKQLVRHIDKKTAYAMVEEGAVWLDVRTPEEYGRGSFEDSVNIPLTDLREELAELVFNATYILCCDSGGRSGAAAFMLRHKGFDVYVLEGGISALTPDDLVMAGIPVPGGGQPDAGEAGHDHEVAEVISFEAGACAPDQHEGRETVVVSAAVTSSQALAEMDGGQADLLAVLQQEKVSLLAEIETYRDTEQRLTEQLELLRAELGETGEKLGELYTQARIDDEEKQLLRDQYAALQEDFNAQQRAHESKQDETAGRIEELQARLDNIQLESQAGSDALSHELGDVKTCNDRLREELAGAIDRASSLEVQLASTLEADSLREKEAADALQQQQDHVQQLQVELAHLGEANAQLQQTLDAARDHEHSTGDQLQNQLQEVEGRYAGLSGELEEVRKELEKKDAELVAESSRVHELDEANRELTRSLDAAQQAIAQLQDESGSMAQQQQDRMDELRAEIAGTKEANEQLRREAEEAVKARDTVRDQLLARLDEVGGHATQTGEELAVLQQELSESAGRLAAEEERAANLQQQNSEQSRMLETLRAEIDAAKVENESLGISASEKQTALETELDALRAELSRVTEHSREAASDLERSVETIQKLEQEKAVLDTALQETESRLIEQREQAGRLEREKEEALNAASRHGEEAASELRMLGEDLEAERQEKARLQAELESGREAYNAERQRLESELAQQQSRNDALIGEHEERLAGLQEAKAKSEETLVQRQAELQELQQKYAGELEEKAGLQEKNAALEEKYAADMSDRDRQITEMQASFQTSQEKVGELRQFVEEKDTQLDALQQEITRREENRCLIEEQLESSREQNRQLRHEMELYEQHAREAEAEYQESIQKVHADLARKIDYEKELQGQVDRLRKQLEQATLDLHKQRESAQEDLDNLREQLHSERRERSGERAEMAARQRELKEQLASIANAHEANLGKHSPDPEMSRELIRAEEQLREVLEAQAQTEDQILRLQQDLYQAHEEISQLTLQQKNARQVDVELLQEQNQQAVSTIAQLELQLRQLSGERDSALEEQNGLREKLTALRGEVEVARGLMNVHGQGQAENPARLRAELDEAKKDAEIAVRLRAEAEAARDRMLRERDQLRSQLAAADKKPGVFPDSALEKQAAGKAGTALPVQVGPAPVAAARNQQAGLPAGQKAKQVSATGSRRRWFAPAVVLGVSGIMVLAIWMLPATKNLLPDIGSVATLTDKLVSWNATRPATESETVLPGGGSAGVAENTRQESAREEVTASVAEYPAGPLQSAAGKSTEVASVSAVRSFRDALKGGGKGPVMMELPAATYQMGSLGNSLNYDESPRHKVNLPGFSISKHEVSFAEYDRFARATGRGLPADENWGRGNRPVINVSWNDAVAYTEWLSMQTGKRYRLPTEAEWEYAIRAGGGSRYWWDNEAEGVYANCFNCGSEWDNRQTSPAGSFPANRFGLHDMAGNVQEWTQDCYKTGYHDAPTDGSAWLTPLCTQHAVRGGGYTSPLDTLRSARRSQYDQETRLDNLGFRVARDN